MLNLAGAIIFGEFLFVVIKTGSETTFGIFVHGLSADLEFDYLFVWSDDGGVERLITVLFGDGEIIFDASSHGSIERMDESEGEIAVGDVVDDDAESDKVVDFIDVLIVFGELFVEGIDGLGAPVYFEGNFFGGEEVGDLFANLGKSLGGGFGVGLEEDFELVVAFFVDIGEGEVGEFDAEFAHVEAIGERGEDFEGLFGDLFLLVGGEGGEGAEIVEAIGEFDDEDANVGAEGDEEAEEIVFGLREVGVEVAHVGAEMADFRDSVY